MLHSGTSLVVQWLRLCDSNAGSAGSIPGWGSKILHVLQCGKKKKKKKLPPAAGVAGTGRSHLVETARKLGPLFWQVIWILRA